MVSGESNHEHETTVPWWQPVVFAACAGGMAWGIRGQYGHETGAMIAGLLVSLTLVLLLCPRASSRQVVRAVAWGTVAMGFGGSMTYGQTVGLTHNPEMVGHVGALMWGLAGLAIKGGLWIGFAGVFLGMGLSGVRYRPRQMLWLMLGIVAAFVVGVLVFNSPFNPQEKSLPPVYFSADWRWQPGAELEPRHEWWGGLLVALALTIAYAGWKRKDRLARNMALWGILGGALGFPLGQCLQAYHAWNPEIFQQGIWQQLDPHMNWWNWMETTFGTIMGAALGLGLWLNRRSIAPVAEDDEDRPAPGVPWAMLAVHLVLLYFVEFHSVFVVDVVYDMGVVMGILPMVAIAAGGWWPYAVVFPVTLMPIAGKTVVQLVYEEEAIGLAAGWLVYAVIPLLVAIGAAAWFYRMAGVGLSARALASRALLLCTWLYFLLNYAFFRFPWPWAEWTGRTPNGIVFTLCTFALTGLAVYHLVQKQGEGAP
ncbi:MAG TPA: hypothetical protein ENN87_07745, partial [Phycisphaerales bacterium]|nr:hypothetical protein [Phycisphaerales bacterium]